MTSRSAADFERLGIYDPTWPDAADRLRLIEFLVELGASDEELLAAHRNSNAGGLALDLATRAAGPVMTFDEATARAGLSSDEAARFIRALGFPDPRIGARLAPAENIEYLATVLTGARELLGPDTTLAIARVLGSTTYRLAQTVVTAMRTNFETPQLQSGVHYSEVIRSYVGLTRDLLPAFLGAMEVVFKDHLVNIASGVWSTDEEGATVSELLVGFADMVGFSGLSRGISAGSLAQLIVRFEEVMTDIVSSHGGKVVKLIGDGAMFVVEDKAEGCRAALELVDHFNRSQDLPSVHVGLAAGPLVTLNGDYFGDAVNTAARLHDLAPASKVLVDEQLAAAVRDAFSLHDVSVWLGATDVTGSIYELQNAGDLE